MIDDLKDVLEKLAPKKTEVQTTKDERKRVFPIAFFWNSFNHS